MIYNFTYETLHGYWIEATADLDPYFNFCYTPPELDHIVVNAIQITDNNGHERELNRKCGFYKKLVEYINMYELEQIEQECIDDSE